MAKFTGITHPPNHWAAREIFALQMGRDILIQNGWFQILKTTKMVQIAKSTETQNWNHQTMGYHSYSTTLSQPHDFTINAYQSVETQIFQKGWFPNPFKLNRCISKSTLIFSWLGYISIHIIHAMFSWSSFTNPFRRFLLGSCCRRVPHPAARLKTSAPGWLDPRRWSCWGLPRCSKTWRNGKINQF